MLNDIRRIIGRNISVNGISQSQQSDIYEAYIFSLLIRAARQEGATISYFDAHGNTANGLLFRTAPGNMFSNAQNYTHAQIEFPSGHVFEAHVGVRVLGISGVLHEADVMLIDAVEGEMCRRNQMHPSSSKVIVFAECKYYSVSLGLHLARAFIGLDSDIKSKGVLFVTNTTSQSVEKLLSAKNKKWKRDVYPGSPQNDDGILISTYRDILRAYIAQGR